MGEMMKVVIVEPQKRPYVKEIEHTRLRCFPGRMDNGRR